MTNEFFKLQMNIIMSDFGREEYTANRMQIIWEHCQDLPNSSFERIVKHFCATKSVKYPPLPTHFHEEALNQRKILNNSGDRKSRNHEGELTHSSGEALSDILKKYGVVSLADVIRKKRSL